jgi:diguanylate cyclase (GGDEF)-like protein
MELPNFKKGFSSPLIRNTLLALLLWTSAAAGSLWWNIRTLQQENLDLAKMSALSDMAFGIWEATHGGVYVSPDENTSSNPYLVPVPSRDVVTTEGKHLTLMNPVYMQPQVIEENTGLLGIKGHVTSLQPTNPINRPDEWEKAALESFQRGAKEATTVVDINDKPHLRIIRPILMEKGCLKCHADTGVKLGDVRGGISVSVPMKPIYAASRAQSRNIILFQGATWLLGMGFIGLVALGSKRESAERRRAQQAEELASHDSLTELYNHRMFYSLLKDEIVRTQRYNRPVSLLMLDIDYFKCVNDTRGHQAGDAILKGLSELLMKQARAIDRVCRYGGEEFTVILTETEAVAAMSIAERLRAAVEHQSFDIGGGKTISITVSIGVATYPQQANSLEELVKASDVALYAAKGSGRNRVCRYDPEAAGEKTPA